MSLTVGCPRCETLIEAEDEDDLVAKVRQHVREDHGLDHTLPAKHILARLRRDGPRHDDAKRCSGFVNSQNPPQRGGLGEQAREG